jgi:branched-chain amino acid transport system substrate-binding protein
MRVRPFGVSLAVLLLAAACGGGGPGIGGGTPASNIPDTIKVAAALPLSGADATPGGFFDKAYKLYVKQVNDAGGLNIAGKKVKIDLRTEDNKSDAATSGQLYEKFVTQDNVDFLLGGYNTTSVTQEVKVANRLGMVYVGAGGASSSIYVDNKWAFGVLASIQKLSATQLAFMKDAQDAGKLPKPTKIAVAYENSSHGKEFLQGIQDGAKAAPDRFQVVFDSAFDLSGKDYTSLLNKVRDVKADAYMVDARVGDMITMQTQYAQLGMYHRYLTYGPRGPEQQARDQLKSQSDYIIAATWWDSLMPGDTIKKFNETWTAAKLTPSASWFEAGAWEAARILFTGIEKSGGVDKQKVHDTIMNTTWDSSIFPGGAIKFGTTGQADNDYVMTQNTPDGKHILIWPKALATGTATVPIPPK